MVDVNGDEQAPQHVYDGVRNLEGVASAGEPQFNDKKKVAMVFVTPDSAPQDEQTEELVDRLRGDVVPAATEGSDAAVSSPGWVRRSSTSATGSSSGCHCSCFTSSA